MKSLLSRVESLKQVPESWQASIQDYLKKQGRLELWTGIVGITNLKRSGDEAARNREAESACVRRQVWGEQTNGKADAMNDTYLGDVNHIHQVKPSGTGNLVKGLLGAGLLATGIGAPLGGMMIANALKDTAKEVVTQPEFADTDTDTQHQLGLGHE